MAIVLTEKDCAVLGPGWQRYENMGGRFPIGAGTTTDGRGQERTFELGQAYGRYQHDLSVAEMPEHEHSYQDQYLNNEESENANRGDDDDEERRYNKDNRLTGRTGQGQPHNNMPPYRVVNFCQLGGERP